MTKKIILAAMATICFTLTAFGFGLVGVNAADEVTKADFKSTGASVKYATDIDNGGIRFNHLILKEKFNTLVDDVDGKSVFKDGVSVTAYVVPTDLIDGESVTAEAIINDTDTMSTQIPAHKWHAWSEDTDYMISYTYIYDMPSVSYARKLSSVAVLNDGVIETTDDVVTRSIVEVANGILYVNAWNGTGEQETALKGYLNDYKYGLTLEKSSAKVFYSATETVENTVQLKANTNLPTKVTFASSDTSVATVSETGLVTAQKAGTAKITATAVGSGETAECTVTVQGYYKITTAEEFWNINNDLSGYYVLANDIDFENQPHIGIGSSFNQAAADIAQKFTGTFDGNGYALKNLKTFPAWVSGYDITNNNPFNQTVFANVTGTIKNVAAYITLDCRTTNVRQAGFIGIAHSTATVENCYVKITTSSLSYNQNGVGLVAWSYGVTVKNCVSVIDVTSGTENRSNYGAIIGYIQPNDATTYIKNSYGVLLQNGTLPLQLVSNNSNANASKASVDDNSVCVASLAELYPVISADGVLANTNGWNMDVWSITNGVLKFGDEQIFATYTISTVEDFLKINEDLSGYYVLANDIDFSAQEFNNSSDTNVWYAIGMANGGISNYDKIEGFTGIIDGNGYTLKNVTVKGINGGGISAALIAKSIGATIKNLGVEITLSANATNESAREVGLIGQARNTTIENCYIRLKTKQAGYGQNYIGVVASQNYSNTIKNCVSVLDVSEGFTSSNKTTLGSVVGLGNDTGTKISNTYSAMLRSSSDTQELKIAGSATNITIEDSSVSASLAELYNAISADGVLVSVNGWNMNIWSVANNTLKFGTTTIYSAE